MKVNIPEDVLEYGLDSSVVIDFAEQEDLQIIFPDEYTLQLDIDSGTQYDAYLSRLEFFKKFFSIKSTEIKPSKEGLPHQHITIKLEHPVTDIERIFLQLVLGSDLKREVYSFLRIQIGDKHPTLFLEKK